MTYVPPSASFDLPSLDRAVLRAHCRAEELRTKRCFVCGGWRGQEYGPHRNDFDTHFDNDRVCILDQPGAWARLHNWSTFDDRKWLAAFDQVDAFKGLIHAAKRVFDRNDPSFGQTVAMIYIPEWIREMIKDYDSGKLPGMNEISPVDFLEAIGASRAKPLA